MLFEGEPQEEARVAEGVDQGQPLYHAEGDDAEEEGGDVAEEGVAIEADDLVLGEGYLWECHVVALQDFEHGEEH